MATRRIQIGIALAAAAALAQGPAVEAKPSSSATPKKSAAPASHVVDPNLRQHRRTTIDADQLKADEMLSDLRDLRLSLGQVKQQAINLFLEATRAQLTPDTSALHTSPTALDDSMLEPTAKYLPPRREWLVYYINTLEPIIHLLTDDIHDVDTTERLAPKEIVDRINPLWTTWKQDVADMKTSLDRVQALIEPDHGTNLGLAKEAISIFKNAERLEEVRFKVYEHFQHYYQAQEKAGAAAH